MGESVFVQALERGVAAHRAGRVEEALACYREALALRPDDAEALSLAGLALAHAGRTAEALPLLHRAIEIEPAQTGFRMNLVQALTASRDWPGLDAFARDWTQRYPQDTEGWRAAARAAFETGRYRLARDLFAKLLALKPPDCADLTTCAGLSLHALEFDAAARCLAQAEALDPNHAPMLANRALLLTYLGRFDEAERYSLRAISRDPAHVPAYSTLSRVRRGRLSDGERAAVARIANDASAPVERRIPAAFAVAHAFDAATEFDAAFAAYEYAHALAVERDRREGRGYDREAAEERDRRLTRLADGRRLPGAARRPHPIFIFGMPRSGTTLVESVLAAHSRVFGGGERPALQRILSAWLDLEAAGRAPAEGLLRDWAAEYLESLPASGAADHVTDKHPLNFEAVPLIARLFPDAVLIHVRRNPVETGLSIFRQEFSKHWTFAHRLADIGHCFGRHARLVAHWQRAYPGWITTVQYEEFARDFANAAPALVRACGLEWEPACLDFRTSARAIATFSAVQAREPVRVAEPRAGRYAKHLAALVSEIAASGVDPDTGALR